MSQNDFMSKRGLTRKSVLTLQESCSLAGRCIQISRILACAHFAKFGRNEEGEFWNATKCSFVQSLFLHKFYLATPSPVH